MDKISFTNKFIGMEIVKNLKKNDPLSKIKAKLLVLALPIFHTIDASCYLGRYVRAALTGKKVVKLGHEEIKKSACLQIRIRVSASHEAIAN